MTYIVKHLNNGTCGVYDTIRGCFPVAGPELREAGVSRIEGTAPNGWFKKSEREEAEAIASSLNAYYGFADGEQEAKVTKPKAKAAAIEDGREAVKKGSRRSAVIDDEAAFQKAGKALIDAEKKARA